jgi:hypothetical protein
VLRGSVNVVWPGGPAGYPAARSRQHRAVGQIYIIPDRTVTEQPPPTTLSRA